MKILSVKYQVFACFFVTLFVCLLLVTHAHAVLNCVQGSSGQLYNPASHDTAVQPKLYYNWGMGYQQKPNSTNVLIFPIPSIGASSVRFIVLNLKGVLGGDIYVDRVSIWSGETEIVDDITVNWVGDDVGWQVVDLGALHTVTSLSIGLRTRTGDFGGMLKVFTVCADFVM